MLIHLGRPQQVLKGTNGGWHVLDLEASEQSSICMNNDGSTFISKHEPMLYEIC